MTQNGGVQMNISFSPPDITEEEIQAVAEALRSGWITTGPRTKEFEREIAEFCGSKRAACLNSATACLETALRLLDIGPGDEVIVPAYTYTASASVVCHVGAKLVLIDVGKGTYQLDYDALDAAINEHTKAVIPVDIGGVMVDYDRIRAIVESKKHIFKAESELQEALGRVAILADSAHGFGASEGGVMSGMKADFTSFSFHAVKNLTTAEGGALTWRELPGVDDEDIYKKIMLYSLHGQSKDALAKTRLGAWEYDIKGTYYKCNMTDIMASIGLVQLARYPELLKRRRDIIGRYTEGIRADDIDVMPHYTDKYTSSGHLFLVRLLGRGEEDRNELITKMAEAGVATNVHYKPLPMHTAYKNLGFDIKDFPNSYDMYHNEITLPLHTLLTDEQVEYVISRFNSLR
ncbi:MAG: DegT/DnrJ/EryC1/StrS family aminotransferase [Clostridia bacterium]|nr:DegT/DnrJ/EryC1/StrS family aminotransferase [Clostridia bacterium]